MPESQSVTVQNRRTNVGPAERLVSTAVGGVLAVNALRKPSFKNLAGAALGADLIYRGLSGHCQFYGSLGIDTAAATKSGSQIGPRAQEVKRCITVGRGTEEVYSFWRDSEKLAAIMEHFAEVTPKSQGVTYWRVRGPLGQVLEWESRQQEEVPGRILSWESLPGGMLPNNGRVSFEPAVNGLGTEVRLELRFEPPLGPVGARLTKAFHVVPYTIAGKALRNFKSLIETGEIPTLENNPSGRGQSDSF